jgi:quinol monooxygenase YgiN
MSFGIIPRLKVKDGKGPELENILARLVELTRANEPRNQFYSIFKSRSDGSYVVVEVFDDEAALEIHRNSPYMQAGLPEINALLAEPYSVEFFDRIK